MTRALVILLVCATPAFAQKSDEARTHFKAGKQLQDGGKFSEAADEYQAAYDLDPRPAMLFNIAQAHRLAGHKQLAVDNYKRYLAAQPDGAGAREARQWLAELTRQLEAERPVVTPKEPTPPVTPPATPTRAPPLTPPSQQPEHPPASAASSPKLRLVGIGVGVAGLAAVGAGIAFGFKARSDEATINDHDMGSWTQAEMDAFDAGKRANTYMFVSYAAGGALIVTGSVLYVLGMRTHVMPLAAPGSAGLAVKGQF